MRSFSIFAALTLVSLATGSLACGGDSGGDGDASSTTLSTTSITATGETGGDGDGDGDAETATGDGDGDGDATSGDGDGDGAFAGTLYLNFDGVELVDGGEDSHMNQTQIAEMVGTAEPYGGTNEKLSVAQAVKDRLAGFSIDVVIERPASGDYHMMVITPTNPIGSGTSGIGPSDCNNSNPNNIGFSFYSFDGTDSAERQASGILRIFGFMHGLENVVTSQDVMSASAASPMPTFRDECLALDAPPSGCGTQHEAHCAAGEQNSGQEMAAWYPLG